RNQRVADARTPGTQSDIYKGISRADEEGRNAVRTWCDLERSFFLCLDSFLACLLRLPLRSFRSFRSSGSHDHPDSTAPGFFLSVALCDSLVPSGLDGNAGSTDRPRRWNSCPSSAAIFIGRR